MISAIPQLGLIEAANTRQAVGLLAGAGRFPILFALKARELNIPVVCLGMPGMADPKLKDICETFRWQKRLSLGFALRTFKRGNVKNWTMAGKFHKTTLFQPWRWVHLMPDWRLLRLWWSHRQDNKDDTLLLMLISEFRRHGMECASALELCPELLVKQGNLTNRTTTAKEDADIAFGWTLAREMGRLDVGQSVMVKDRAVLAVEAIEGTDKAIARAGELCGKSPFVVVKVAKPEQDMRFDVPTVGPDTIQTMAAAGGRVLAIEAGRTIILDESETIRLANLHKIAIKAISTSV